MIFRKRKDSDEMQVVSKCKEREWNMLGNFGYCNPTKLYFGEKALLSLNKELPKYGKKVLLVYGGGSIKKNGIYDDVIKILGEHEKNVIEDSGVMPNPTVDKLKEGVKIARENDIDFVLAIGGGSVCDYAKALCASVYCEEDPWQKYFIKQERLSNEVLPLGCVLTMAGTGSEMNGGSVITNTDTSEKIAAIFPENVFPKFSILNPIWTFSVPKYQMIAGIFDIMSHLLEQYFSGEDDNTSDYIIEGLLKSLIQSSQIAVQNPQDYEARSNIMWCATWALNGLVSKGKSTDWMVHMIGQSMGGYTDATHGMTLSSVSIPYYRHIMKYGLPKFKRYAINVWSVNPEGKTDEEIAREGLDKMEAYMRELGLVMNAKELGMREDMLESVAKGTFILDGGYKLLSQEDIIEILKESMAS